MAATPPLAGRVFRAGSGFELVVFDRLPLEEQAALAALASEPDFYGVLRPRHDHGHTAKAVNRDTALLWLTLQQPGPLPFFAAGASDDAAQALWQLVLDGVLETETSAGFVGGVQAAAALSGPATGAERGAGRLAQLSRSALLHVERSGLRDAAALAARLYRFGIEPVTPAWQARLPDADAVLVHVGAAPGAALRRAIDAAWDAAPRGADEPGNGWLAWSRKERAAVPAGQPTHKLYVSPRAEALPMAFEAVLSKPPEGAVAFKIGADAPGLLRPDKMVLYFDSLEALQAAAATLAERLTGVPAHGVPFTSELVASGLLSWGMDPPLRESRLPWQGAESWRLWLVRRLALAMTAALASPVQQGARMGAAAFALERLRHEGVDVDHWTPALRLWRA